MAKSVKKIIITVVVIVVGILIVWFAGKRIIDNYGREYYVDKFFPGTVINGVNVTNMTVDEVKDTLQDYVLTYQLEILERNGKSETIYAKDLDFKYVDDGSVDALMEDQDIELWDRYLNKTKEYTVDAAFSYDKKLAAKKVDQLECFKPENIVLSEDAYISENDEGYFIQPEVYGTNPDKSKVLTAVNAALSSGSLSVDLDESGVYIDPVILSDNPDLVATVAMDNQMLAANVVFDFKDRTWVLDKSVYRSWVIKGEDGSCYIDEGQAAAWVADMAYNTDTFGLGRDFMTSTGQMIHLEGGGDYGWYMDQQATLANVLSYIYAGTVATVEPEYIYTACDRSTNDIGGTYVEVCIESQTLWAYADGQLIANTPVITGCVNTGHATPSGSVWAIDGKKEDWQFTHFRNTHADFWLPFVDECGLHDAQWQGPENYTTTFYLDNGSHGCVNMPLEPMTSIFQVMEIGYPVVVYYSVDQVVGPQPTEALEAG